MGEEQKKLLEQQLWNIANTLRGKMDAVKGIFTSSISIRKRNRMRFGKLVQRL